MNDYEIQSRIRKIRKADGDAEAQHVMEDSLWGDVLRAVTDEDYRVEGRSPYDSEAEWYESELRHIRDLCRAALGTLDIEFPRHCS